jgi:peptidoglycan/LPS O-acetylase OafA/YrhL
MANEPVHPKAEILNTRQHFKALDGLRGVAALAVVTFHFMEMAIYNYTKLFIGHGFLAVDFFFCLSGFVIGYAYDDRVGTMGIKEFLKSRLIRLHPLVILGSVLGLIALLVDPFATAPLAYNVSKVIMMFLTSIFLIPYPAMQERSFNLFSLNAPAWSLFWEYIANIFYALVLYKLSRRPLLFLTAIAAVVLCFVGHHAGIMAGGWSGATFWDGGARVAYSFLAGLLLYRSGWIIRSRLGFSILTILLLLAFLMPFAKGGWIREAVAIIFYFPLMIALGAGATLTARSEKICTFAGNMSYPLYMTHYSVIWIFGNYYSTYKPDAEHLAFIVISGVIIMSGVAYVAMVMYDVPIRRYLTARRTFARQ